MKSYKEIAQMLEVNIDKQMLDVDEALAYDVAYTMEMWNTSVIRTDKEEDNYTLEEKVEGYTKMLGYAEQLLESSLTSHNKTGVSRGLYVFHIYTTMKENLLELKDLVVKV